MANNDYFAEIAMTRHPLGNGDREVVPAPKATTVFSQSESAFPYEQVRFPQEETDAERLEQFQRELADLRDRYRPFMENRMEPLEMPETVELKEFQFRYLKKGEIFSQREREADWESVTIPDYRGPIGKWKAYYKTTFPARQPEEKERGVLAFECVDYKARIYVNGCYVGGHEGFFAPFSFDVSDYLRAGAENELIIEVENDYSILGEGPVLDGDKIYAATGPGWDDPETGWHHCPAGAGVLGKVTFEYRPSVYIDDIFVRPDIDRNFVELRVGVYNYTEELQETYALDVKLKPRNFEPEQGTERVAPSDVTGESSDHFASAFVSEQQVDFHADIRVIGVGSNEYRYRIPFANYRLWEPETPWLYGAVCTLSWDGQRVSERAVHFGMRKFVSDETTKPKGKFFFNNRPIVLRGANEMGHLQQCVMNGDTEQLIDDILIAKMCHMNYYRLTQRPVQKEIYDYMDMLGMFNQTDLPLFSFLRRPQLCEALKQTTEMEHLLRSHPSAIMVTFINEAVCLRRTENPNDKYSRRYELKGHRHLLRDELEAFFAAARKVIYVENPDRVIKNVEGDYDPPTGEGMPDFHCYTMWYSNHGVPIGKLYRGYLPPVKPGWMIGCGEYGAEGLDNEKLMRERYPAQWLETDENGNWYPVKIVREQTNGAHGDWYPEQHTLAEWVEQSQIHQARATRMMTDAFRRRADVLNHTAIHLLIDAWPAGWMKTLVGCDRLPKKAYFAYQDSLVPLRVNLRSDRSYLYSGETCQVEAWVLNDTSCEEEVTVLAAVRPAGSTAEPGKGTQGTLAEGKPGDMPVEAPAPVKTYEMTVTVPAVNVVCAGLLPVHTPRVDRITELYVDAAIVRKDKTVLNAERQMLYVYPELERTYGPGRVLCFGKEAEEIAGDLGYEVVCDGATAPILVSDPQGREEELSRAVREGGTAVLILSENMTQCDVGDLHIASRPGPKLFIAMGAAGMEKYHFDMLYNEDKDYIDFIANRVIESSQKGEELYFTYAKKGENGAEAPKLHLPLAEKFVVGKGKLYAVSLLLKGRVGANANLDAFLTDCLEGRV